MEKRLIEAAEAGDPRAQCNLGILYDNGLDDNGYRVQGNKPLAVRWLLAAAEQTSRSLKSNSPKSTPRGPVFGQPREARADGSSLAAMGLRRDPSLPGSIGIPN